MRDAFAPVAPLDQATDTPAATEPLSTFDAAKAVLEKNYRGSYTVPGARLYPHQWLWDSCFIAIGQRHYDVERAKTEIYSLLRGQWANGMLPNIIFNDDRRYRTDRNAWRSWLNPNSPDGISTSGITQPPMLAEAVVRIGEKMPADERRRWYKSVWPALLAYHHWLYNERDPHGEGLVLQIHPWEVGMDNTPPWMAYLHEHQLPLWIRTIQKLHLTGAVTWLRRDTQTIPIDERFDNVEIMALYDVQQRFRRKGYDIDKMLRHSLFVIEDLAFNAIFIRANQQLRAIAKTLRTELPDGLDERMQQTEKAFEKLWDEQTKQYYSRDFITHDLLRQPSVATLLPLYAGCISKERAAQLVRFLENEHSFGPAFPVPSVPANSRWFKPMKYWQGPTWMNINWLIIDGLRRYGFHEHANALTDLSIEMVEKSGFAEYFDPITGEPLGADDFSWTAALAIDMLKNQ
ncbi:MAG TPA: trehalase family glycosidase [Candidatus Saccharimonadales bacterium]|nr:trehalase family glycosidase [Candidatus Saccharimonadales bacterium]